MEKICKHCKTSILSGKKLKFCTPCKRLAKKLQDRNASKLKHVRQCKKCEVEVFGRQIKYCKPCGLQVKKQKIALQTVKNSPRKNFICLFCNQVELKGNQQKYCSENCRKDNLKKLKKKPVRTINCGKCNIEIVLPAKSANRKFCKPCREIIDFERERNWRQSHPVESKISSQKYRVKNIDLMREKSRQWNKENKEHKRVLTQNRRTMMKLNGGTLTLEDWEQIKREQNYKCWDCGIETELTIGHAIPVCKGGRTEYINVLGQCMPCNHKQGPNIHPTFKTYGNHPIVMRLAKLFGDDNQSEEYWNNIESLVKSQYDKGIW